MFIFARKMQYWWQRRFTKFGNDILYRLGVIAKVHQGGGGGGDVWRPPANANRGLSQSIMRVTVYATFIQPDITYQASNEGEDPSLTHALVTMTAREALRSDIHSYERSRVFPYKRRPPTIDVLPRRHSPTAPPHYQRTMVMSPRFKTAQCATEPHPYILILWGDRQRSFCFLMEEGIGGGGGATSRPFPSSIGQRKEHTTHTGVVFLFYGDEMTLRKWHIFIITHSCAIVDYSIGLLIQSVHSSRWRWPIQRLFRLVACTSKTLHAREVTPDTTGLGEGWYPPSETWKTMQPSQAQSMALASP